MSKPYEIAFMEKCAEEMRNAAYEAGRASRGGEVEALQADLTTHRELMVRQLAGNQALRDEVEKLQLELKVALRAIDRRDELNKILNDSLDQLRLETENIDALRADCGRLDFLELSVMDHGGISAKRDSDPFVGSPTFGPLTTMTLFTVPSQFVRAAGLRNAIDLAKEAKT